MVKIIGTEEEKYVCERKRIVAFGTLCGNLYRFFNHVYEINCLLYHGSDRIIKKVTIKFSHVI